jgi:hypothetical protein
MKHVLLLSTVVLLAGGTRKTVPHDGRWWLSISTEEQQSYQLGYEDCYVDSLKLKSPPYVEIGKLARLITASYRDGKTESTVLVPAVTKRVWAANAGRKSALPPKGGETWTEPHGYFNGLWWKGASDAEKLGFVEGETDCFNEEESSHVRFPLAASEYVKSLDEAYRLELNRPVSRLPEDTKIPDALLQKGERKPGSAPRPSIHPRSQR